jgi:hypothetical protein
VKTNTFFMLILVDMLNFFSSVQQSVP